LTMAIWKMPPKAKVYEALGALADGRVKIVAEGKGEVVSSTGNKSYSVEWSKDLSSFSSNDNASYWQGYLGYPIIAVLCTLEKIEYNATVSNHLAGVHWKELNKKHKNNYDSAVDEVLASVQRSGIDSQVVVQEVDNIMNQLQALKLDRLQRRSSPPKG